MPTPPPTTLRVESKHVQRAAPGACGLGRALGFAPNCALGPPSVAANSTANIHAGKPAGPPAGYAPIPAFWGLRSGTLSEKELVLYASPCFFVPPSGVFLARFDGLREGIGPRPKKIPCVSFETTFGPPSLRGWGRNLIYRGVQSRLRSLVLVP